MSPPGLGRFRPPGGVRVEVQVLELLWVFSTPEWRKEPCLGSGTDTLSQVQVQPALVPRSRRGKETRDVPPDQAQSKEGDRIDKQGTQPGRSSQAQARESVKASEPSERPCCTPPDKTTTETPRRRTVTWIGASPYTSIRCEATGTEENKGRDTNPKPGQHHGHRPMSTLKAKGTRINQVRTRDATRT